MTTLRCCAVAFRLDADRATSIASFRAAVAEVVDAHVVHHPHAPTLVAFPEHTGLLAMFVGASGEAARARLAAGASTMEAMTALAFGYGDELGRCAQAFPEVRSPGQLLHLACTDTVVRTLLATFGVLAAERGLWMSVGAALPGWAPRSPDDPASRSPDEPASGSPDGPASSRSPGDPASRSPDEPASRPLDDLASRPRDDAATMAPAGVRYTATGPDVRNRNLLFAPDGTLVAVHDKAYLVPMEHDLEAGLGLTPAGLEEVEVADLPFGRVGTVISKDAWMPDVNDRLDQLGAQVLIQPEAFDRWGDVDRVDGVADLWPPDKFQRGGWWMVQRHPSFQVNLAPMLVGNLGELAFDGQPSIAVPSPGGAAELGLLGQPRAAGWAAVGGWGHLDEPVALLADESRRPAFEVLALRHLPGAADPPKGAVAETAAWADVDLPARPPPSAPVPSLPDLPPSMPVTGRGADGPTSGAQLAPDLAGDGRRAWLGWVACDPTRQTVVVAEDAGIGWQEPETVAHRSRQADGTHRRWRPRLAVSDGSVVCLELGFPAGNWDLFATRRAAAGRWSAPVRVDDAHADRGVLRERGHDAPVLVRDRTRARDGGDVSGGSGGDSGLIAVWSDLRWPWVFPQVRLARSTDGGLTWSASERVDGGSFDGEPDPLAPRSPAETRGQTAPAAAVASDGRLLVAWQERSDAGADICFVRFEEGSGREVERLGAAERPRDGAAAAPGGGGGGPRLEARPVLATSGSTSWLVWEEWAPDGGAALLVRCSTDAGRTWSRPHAVDGSRPAGTTQRRATIVPDAEGGAVVVFEDDRTGESRVVTVRLGRTATAAHPATAARLEAAALPVPAVGPPERSPLHLGAVVRLDDAPDGDHARAPTAVLVGGDLVVAWQDTRDGWEHVRTNRLALRNIPGGGT